MFDQLVIHPKTKDQLLTCLQTPPHALLLVGQDGIGKGTLLREIAATLLAVAPNKLATTPGFKHIDPQAKDSISIETIRALQQFVRLKTTGTATIRRVIAVEHAAAMTGEAQNAFLKLLEEPPTDTVILMTAGQLHDLLPTIQSRVQHLSVAVPDKEQLQQFFKAHSAQHVTQAYFLSGGLPGLMSALLEGDQTHPLFQSVVLAKQLLQQPLFERLLLVDQIAKEKGEAALLCDALSRIAQAALQQAATKTDDKLIRRWHHILQATYRTQQACQVNANTKLALSNLLLQL